MVLTLFARFVRSQKSSVETKCLASWKACTRVYMGISRSTNFDPPPPRFRLFVSTGMVFFSKGLAFASALMVLV